MLALPKLDRIGNEKRRRLRKSIPRGPGILKVSTIAFDREIVSDNDA